LPRLLPAGVADDNVEAAEALDGAPNQFLAEFLVPDIAQDRNASPT
jgi:hypothetical protein